MDFDTLFLILANGKKITMVSGNTDYDYHYSAISNELIGMLNNSVFDGEELERRSQFGLAYCQEDFDEIEPTVIIDFDNQKITLPKIKLQHIEEFEDYWGAELMIEDGKAFIKWDEEETEELIRAKEEIDGIYPLIKKDELTFEEFKKYSEFIFWCSTQDSTTFEYCDSLVYHFEPVD